MSSDRTAMLFCAPLPPLRLGSEPVLIGRHSSCDLSIRADDLSRRHAQVWQEDGRYRVKDLGSTNGTFRNGERIDGGCVLEPGDQIELGSSRVTFCQVEVAIDLPDLDRDTVEEAKTVIRFATPGREAFRGELSEIPPPALLQVLELGSKTGLLEVAMAEGPGRLWVVDGRPTHAEVGKRVGFDAAIEIVGCSDGRFRFDPQAVEVSPTIDASVTELLLEAARLEDER